VVSRVQVCGRLAVTRAGERVEALLPARQGRLLFTFLVVHRARVVTRDELVDALWPAGPAPPAADATLRALLSRLRRVLGADVVPPGDPPRLALPDDAFVDLEAARAALHRAEAAVAEGAFTRAWAPARIALHTAERGFLPAHDAPWAAAIRRELDELRLRAVESVGAAGMGMGGGELDAAERAGRRLVALAPYRESGHRLLMEALAARGNPAEAALVFARLRERLRDDLGLTPCAATRSTAEKLLRSG